MRCEFTQLLIDHCEDESGMNTHRSEWKVHVQLTDDTAITLFTPDEDVLNANANTVTSIDHEDTIQLKRS